MIKRNVLVVEDEEKIAKLLLDYLHQESFNCHWINDGNDVTPYLQSHSVDLVLLDVMLPKKNGLQICREVRAFSTVPIIMVTARVDDIDRMLGLELGADDYVCKPFNPREVVARVKAIFRRIDFMLDQKSAALSVGEIAVDEQQYTARVGADDLKLTPTEFQLLVTFIRQPNRVFSRGQLLDVLKGFSFEGYERTIDSHVKNLRKKIHKAIANREVIASVYGVGYKLNYPFEDKL